MGFFSCFSRPKITDKAESEHGVLYNLDGLDIKDGSAAGSPTKGRRADSLSGSPRKQIHIESLFKTKQLASGTSLHAMATATGAPGTAGNVDLSNARALVRALARKPESRRVLSCQHQFLCVKMGSAQVPHGGPTALQTHTFSCGCLPQEASVQAAGAGRARQAGDVVGGGGLPHGPLQRPPGAATAPHACSY